MQKTDSISEGMCRAGACTHAVLSFLPFSGLRGKPGSWTSRFTGMGRMLGRKLLSSVALALVCGGTASAQDLGSYDVNNYSGGYAEGAYSPQGDEQLYPYDSQDQWQHGYIQYMPFYGAYKHFRPYNYKHVSAQTQTAAGWGMSPRLPYSQQFWHRYHAHAKMGHSATGAYETYLDVPVPQRQPSHSEGEVQPPAPKPLQQAPVPYNVPGLNVPPLPNSAQFLPQYPNDSYTGISYQQMPPQGQYQPMYPNPPVGRYQAPVAAPVYYGEPVFQYPSGQPYSSQQPIMLVP